MDEEKTAQQNIFVTNQGGHFKTFYFHFYVAAFLLVMCQKNRGILVLAEHITDLLGAVFIPHSSIYLFLKILFIERFIPSSLTNDCVTKIWRQ